MSDDERSAWKDTALFHAKNEGYYRGLLVQIGELLGDDAKRCDDGTLSDDVLVAKLPELIKQRLAIPSGED